MSKKERKKYTSETKTKIVLEMLREDLTIAQISSKYEISAKTILNWKKQFLDNASLAFEPAKANSEYKAQIYEDDGHRGYLST